MAYTLDALAVQEVTVKGTMNSQLIVNKYWYRANNPLGPGGTSDFFLANFALNFRAGPLSFMYNNFSVSQYEVRQILKAVLVPGSVPPRWRSSYDVLGLDILAGVGADVGANPLGGGAVRLPAHEALRVFKAPTSYAVGYFKGNYNRYTSFTSSEKDASQEIWAPAFVTLVNAAMLTFNGTAVWSDAASTIGWGSCVWSPAYYGTLVVGSKARDATLGVASQKANKFVGTQVSRRFSPLGIPHGV